MSDHWEIVCCDNNDDVLDLLDILNEKNINYEFSSVSTEECDFMSQKLQEDGYEHHPPFIWVNDDYLGGYDTAVKMLRGNRYKEESIDLLESVVNYETSLFRGCQPHEIAGLKYISQRHPKECILFSDISLTTEYFSRFQLVYSIDKKELGAPVELWERLDKCNGKRFSVILLGIEGKSFMHLNVLVYDSISRTMERFEPHGISPKEIENEDIDSLIIDKFRRTMGENYIKIYYKPLDFCPAISFQLIPQIRNEKVNPNDPGGFCAVWSLWYSDLRLTNPTIERQELIKRSINTMISLNYNFTQFIRNYSMVLYNFYEEIKNINDLK